MSDIDFIELATSCRSLYKERVRNYRSTLYVSISEDNELVRSNNPSILKNAHRCLLVHTRFSRYYMHDVEFIDEGGRVFENAFDERFALYSVSQGLYVEPFLSYLYMRYRTKNCHTPYGGIDIYSCKYPFEQHLANIWKLYVRLREYQNDSEIEMVAKLLEKDRQISYLDNMQKDLQAKNIILEAIKQQHETLIAELKSIIKENNQSVE